MPSNQSNVYILDIGSGQNPKSVCAKLAAAASQILLPDQIKHIVLEIKVDEIRKDVVLSRKLGKNFRELLKQISSGTFEGTLFCRLPDILSSSFREILCDEYNCLLASTLRVASKPNPESQKKNEIASSIEHILWALESNCTRPVSIKQFLVSVSQLANLAAVEGRAVFLCHSVLPNAGGRIPQVADSGMKGNDDGWLFKVESLQVFEDPIDYLRTKLGRDLYRFAPTRKERRLRKHIKEQFVSPNWGVMSCDPYEDEYYDWFRQELGSREITRKFLDMARQALIENDAEESVSLLRSEVQIAIGVARVARRMATWTLEGQPFECTLFLMPDRIFESLGTRSSGVSRLINLQPPVPFNFPNISSIRKHAEIAQSRGLYLVINARDGNMHCIGAPLSSSTADYAELYRHLVRSHSILYNIKPFGIVDVYAQGKLEFSYDGFEWINRPLAVLDCVLEKFFVKESATDRNRIERMLAATRLLLERHESSIIVLLNNRDRQAASEVLLEPLRSQIEWPVREYINIDSLEASTLAGLLHLDGAHVVEKHGRIEAISKRINVPTFRYLIPGFTSEQLNKIQTQIDEEGRYGELDVDVTSGEIGIREFLSKKGLELHGINLVEKRVSPGSNYLIPLSGRQELLKLILKDLSPGACFKMKSAHELQRDEVGRIEAHLRKKMKLLLRNKKKEKPYQIIELSIAEPNQRCLLVVASSGRRVSEMPKIDFENIRKSIVDEAFAKSIQLKLELSYGYFFRLPISRQLIDERNYEVTRAGGRGWPPGIGADADGCMLFVEYSEIDRAVFGENHDLPPEVRQELLRFIRKQVTTNGAPGTGTRAAQELSRRVPNSFVVKVSASGSASVYFQGAQLSPHWVGNDLATS